MKAEKWNDGEIRITDCYLHRESIREIAGRRWDAESKAWFVPLAQSNIALLQLLGAEIDESLAVMFRPSGTRAREVTAVMRMPIRAEPYAHQVEAFNFALEIFRNGKGTAFLMDMGTGKSLTTIAVIGALNAEGNVRKLLIVCPKSIVGVWEDEFGKFADFDYTLKLLDGATTEKVKTLQQLSRESDATSRCRVAVVNYESAWRLETELTKWKPDMIVCDESSKIKNPQAKQSKALHRLGKISRFNIILTGTPVTNSPLDFFSQYKFLDESVFGSSFYSFRARYAVIGGYGGHEIVGYRNIQELVEKAHSIAFRVRLDEAVDLPPYIDETRLVELEPSARAVYDRIDKESYAELLNGEVTTRNILTRLLRLSQCTGGFIRADADERAVQISRVKLDALEDILDECSEQNKKVVVFARFVPEIEAIERLLKKRSTEYSVIHGGVTDRAEQVERFQTDPNVKVFVGQLQTTGMGLTLTAAGVAVYYSLDYSYANCQQSRAMIHRIGQDKKTLYIHLVVKDSVDGKIMEALKQKGDTAKLLVDEWRKLKGDGSPAAAEPPDTS
jgi:SNF2 family DNA or RNA helicase